MTYYAKDCIQMFLIGAIPSMLFTQGLLCWAAICIARYYWIRMDWKEYESNTCKTKEEFEAKGIHMPNDYFDENGNFIFKL